MRRDIIVGLALTVPLALLAVQAWPVQPLAAQEQPASVTYTLDPGATIAFVVPTDLAPVTLLGSESLSGSFTIVSRSFESIFGGDSFQVVQLELTTGSGRTLRLAAVTLSDDPVFLATGIPSPYLLTIAVPPRASLQAVLTGTGIAPEPGFQGFMTLGQTALMSELPTFAGPTTAPTAFNFTPSQVFTSPGVGLYEYRIVCVFECVTDLRLFAVLRFTARAPAPATPTPSAAPTLTAAPAPTPTAPPAITPIPRTPTTSQAVAASVPTPTTISQTSPSSSGGGVPTEVIVAGIGAFATVVTAALGYVGIRAARRAV
jgi:hypothetical protein